MRVKKNQNQICWKWVKVRTSIAHRVSCATSRLVHTSSAEGALALDWIVKHAGFQASEHGMHHAETELQVVTEGRRPGTVRSFLDSTQYSTTSILRYERIFGSGFVSTGGIETTKVRRSSHCSLLEQVDEACIRMPLAATRLTNPPGCSVAPPSLAARHR